MKQHKWHKEIKAWADGEEVQSRYVDRKHNDDWQTFGFDGIEVEDWNDANFEFRIKPQLKEPQCKKHKDAPHGFCRDASASEDRYVCECEYWEEPKEPQYLYVYADKGGDVSALTKREGKYNEDAYIGKIKLEVDE